MWYTESENPKEMMLVKRVPGAECASICGLFCGACPSYPDACHGCFSDFVRESCRGCKANGFLACAESHGVIRCYRCSEFPCQKLRDFSKAPVINGICNHADVIPDLQRMGEVGVERWIEEKISQHLCPHCGELINWFEMKTHTCK